MTDESPVQVTTIAPLGQLADLTTAKYMKLLFHGGSNAWVKQAYGDYILTLYPTKGTKFTSNDAHACHEVFQKNFGIRFGEYRSTTENDLIDFVITSEELQLLKESGLGRTSIGTLLQKEMAHQEREVSANDVFDVLKEGLRLRVLDYKSWTLAENQKRLVPSGYENELFLPHSFVAELTHAQPDITQDLSVKNMVEYVLAQLVPSASIRVYLAENERGINVKLTVDDENFAKVGNAISDAQQGPGNNITDFALAAQRLKNKAARRE